MVWGCFLAVTACGGEAPESTASPLATLRVDPARVTVSGLSAGAYMAQQVHVALGDRIAGAALFAGGPYGCARGDLKTALGACMNPADTSPDVAALAAIVRERAAAGTVAPLSAMAGDRVFVFHGRQDKVVGESVSRAAAALYGALDAGVTVHEKFDADAAHVFPTVDRGGDCAATAPPYIGKCGFDGAGKAFAALYDVDASARPAAATGRVIEYAQGDYVAGEGDPRLAKTAFAYVPAACEAADARCGLHIAFHGCEQDVAKVGRAFVDDAGFAPWADVARVVVLYPQVEASMMPLNPKGCWDWWGYTGATYDTRDGAQIRHVAALIDAFTRR